ncbi:hypothetical protein RJZ56_003176 [Blastomyces dermatitidis]
MDLTETADDLPSDVLLLWQQALARYHKSTGEDLQKGKWAKAFRDVGNDEDLQSAKSTMKESLAQLESASLTVILTTTQDLKQDTNTIVTQTERIDSRTERIEVSILAQREEFHDMSAKF